MNAGIAGLVVGVVFAAGPTPAMKSGAVNSGVAKSDVATPAIKLCDAVRVQGEDDESDPLVQGKSGWIFRSADLAPNYELDAESHAALSRFVADWKMQGTTVAFILLAPRGYFGAAYVDATDPLAAGFDPGKLAADYSAAVASLRATGALVPDLLQAAVADAVGENYYFRRDHHWRPEATKSAMGALAREVLAAGLRFTPSEWVSTLERERSQPGALARRVEQGCNQPAPALERFDRYVSASVGKHPSAPPEIVLAGSSHTNRGGEDMTNTTGWLREALDTDLVNVGVDGGGYSTGLLRWMDSPTVRSNPPKLLSIEMSARIPQNFPTFMRTAIPTIYGDCSSAAATGKVTLAGQAAPLLYVPPGTRSGGSSIVLDISDPELLNFIVSFTLSTGEEDFLPVVRSPRTPNSGRFYVEAPLSKLGLAGVRIDAGKSSRATISSRLCMLPPTESGVQSLETK